jgi:hypothetical protein
VALEFAEMVGPNAIQPILVEQRSARGHEEFGYAFQQHCARQTLVPVDGQAALVRLGTAALMHSFLAIRAPDRIIDRADHRKFFDVDVVAIERPCAPNAADLVLSRTRNVEARQVVDARGRTSTGR